MIDFDKAMTNDKRNSVVADGRADLSASTGLSSAELNLIPEEFYADIVNEEVAIRLAWEPIGGWFRYPVSTKGEPNRRVQLLTDHLGPTDRERARLMRPATLRSVDSCFHRFRSNVRFASRPQISTNGPGRVWARHHLHDPVVFGKLVEIYRFYHDWMEPGPDGRTPAMRIGLARGRIHERDLLQPFRGCAERHELPQAPSNAWQGASGYLLPEVMMSRRSEGRSLGVKG